MTMTPRVFVQAGIAALVLLAITAIPDPAEAQVRSVSWEETTDFEIPGTMGALLRALPGSPMSGMESRHALFIEESVLRQDDGHTSTVLDLDQQVMLHIDHESRTYMRFTFAQAVDMAGQMEEMMAQAMLEMEEDEELQEAMRQQEEAMEEVRRAQEESAIEWDFRISTEATGETEQVADGIQARRYFVTAELEGTEEIEGAETQDGGILLILVELWQSDDFPDTEALYEEWAQRMAEDPELRALAEEMAEIYDTSGQESGAEALAMWDPRISAGMMEIAEAISELEGTTVRSSTTVALLPSEVEYSRDDLLAWEPESMGSELAGQAGQAMRDAAAGAIRGMFGGRGGGDAEPEEEPARIQPLLRMNSIKSNMVYDPAAPSFVAAMYEELAGYEEIDFGEMIQRMMDEAQTGG
jgi:hypothetical protein